MKHHDWDEDGCCYHCGFDGAEWHHWKTQTYEGRALAGVDSGENKMRIPECIERQPVTIPAGSIVRVWRGSRWETT